MEWFDKREIMEMEKTKKSNSMVLNNNYNNIVLFSSSWHIQYGNGS